jgi:threonyl-tRNA synthetase
MYYIDENGEKALPYIIHRTSLGCYERTLAYLIEKYAGALPTWMSPEQVRVLPISERLADKAAEVNKALQAAGIRSEWDERNEKIGYKIREAQMQKVPYMLVIGDREAESGTVAVRSRKDGDLGAMPLADFIAKITEEIATRAR